jgi:SHS2 domain-containing protein
MYEFVDHTADMGIRVEGENLAGLFVRTAEAFFDVQIQKKKQFSSPIDVPVSVKAANLEELLVRWLQELLYILETRHLVLSDFWIDEIDETHLMASAKGVKFDGTKHRVKLEIKAITCRGLEVRKADDGRWFAKVIFDV